MSETLDDQICFLSSQGSITFHILIFYQKRKVSDTFSEVKCQKSDSVMPLVVFNWSLNDVGFVRRIARVRKYRTLKFTFVRDVSENNFLKMTKSVHMSSSSSSPFLPPAFRFITFLKFWYFSIFFPFLLNLHF